MADEPPSLGYAGRTPNASRHVDEQTKSLGEGCAATAILFVVLPTVAIVVAMARFGCFASVVVFSR